MLHSSATRMSGFRNDGRAIWRSGRRGMRSLRGYWPAHGRGPPSVRGGLFGVRGCIALRGARPPHRGGQGASSAAPTVGDRTRDSKRRKVHGLDPLGLAPPPRPRPERGLRQVREQGRVGRGSIRCMYPPRRHDPRPQRCRAAPKPSRRTSQDGIGLPGAVSEGGVYLVGGLQKRNAKRCIAAESREPATEIMPDESTATRDMRPSHACPVARRSPPNRLVTGT